MEQVRILRLSLFQFDEENPKEHNIGELILSIKRHGFIELPVVNEETGLLVAGHGRVEALQRMVIDQEQPPLYIVEEEDTGEWLVPYISIKFKTDHEAKAYMIASNALTIDGGYNEHKLLDMLMDVNAQTNNLLGTGFDSQDIMDMLHANDKALIFDDDFGKQTHSVSVEADSIEHAKKIKEDLEELGYTCQLKTKTT